jgi:hypothetical protein
MTIKIILLILGNVLIFCVLLFLTSPILICDTCGPIPLFVSFVVFIILMPFILFILKKISLVQFLIIVVGTAFSLLTIIVLLTQI